MDGFKLKRRGALAYLQIDRAARKNAITQAMWTALPSILEGIAEDESVKILILSAAEPGIFSAGADISEFEAIAKDEARRIANADAIRAAFGAMMRFPKPSIAQIEGACVGGGCGLAIACDMRFAAPQARFGITPAKLGLIYSVQETKALIDLVGPAHAQRILFTAALIEAEEAARIGLVNQLIASDQIGACVQGIAESIAQVSQHSVRGIKQITRMIADGVCDDTPQTRDMFLKCYDTADYLEGVSAFLQKRKPSFPMR